MIKVRVYLLKSFGIDKTGGNPAGVVLDSNSLTNEQKMIISKVVNFSETAFVEASKKLILKSDFHSNRRS